MLDCNGRLLSLLNALSALSRAGGENSHYYLINWNCNVNGSMIVLHLPCLKIVLIGLILMEVLTEGQRTENAPYCIMVSLHFNVWLVCMTGRDDLKSKFLTSK